MTRNEPESIKDFKNAFATTLLRWQSIENNLFLIFYYLVQPHRNPSILSVIYYSFRSIQARIEMIDAVAKEDLKDDKDLKEWKRLLKQIKINLGYRNKLAHLALTMQTDNGKAVPLLRPSLFNVKVKQDEISGYSTEEMDKWCKSFRNLASEMAKFLDKLPQMPRVVVKSPF